MLSDIILKKMLGNYSRIIATVLFVLWVAVANGIPAVNDSLQFEILLNNKMLKNIHLDKKFTNSIGITSNRFILLSTSDQFYLLGWGGIKPFGEKASGNIRSYAYTTDNLLMTISNNELCRFDSLGNLIKLFKLPAEGMGISTGKNVMYVYDRINSKSQYSLYVIVKGGKYSKLFDVPSPILSVIEINNSLLFSAENGLFNYNQKSKELKALASLPKGKEIKSIATDTINNRIYFSTDSAVYAYKDSNAILVTDKLGGTLRFFNGGLIVFNPEKQLLIRIVGIENEITTNKLATEVAATTLPTTDILTNESIINLVKAELSDELIIKIINKSEVNFNVGIDSMIELSNQNVSSAVISAMKSAMKKKADVNAKSSN
jgi:hypothetical protein